MNPSRFDRIALMRCARFVDRQPALKRVVVRAALAFSRRSGADPAILKDVAQAQHNRPVHLSLHLLQWARQLKNGQSLVPGFRPDQHMQQPAAVEAAHSGVLQALNTNQNDVELQRQSLLLSPYAGPPTAEARAFVERQLRAALETKAAKQPTRSAVLPETAESLCADIVTVLRDQGLDPFLVSGTMLGAVREAGPISGDYDIDLGILPDITTIEAIASMFHDSTTFAGTVKGQCLTLRHTSGCTIDVFVHYERDGQWWHGTDTSEWWNTPFTLAEVTFGCATYPGPAPAERYLEENYGQWEHPVAFYQVPFDTPNHRFMNNQAALIQLLDQTLEALDTADRFAANRALLALKDHFDIDLRAYIPPSTR